MGQLGIFRVARRCVPALLLMLALTGAGTARAAADRVPTAEEQKAFATGVSAYEAGDARGAERAWKAGYQVARDPAFLVRIAEAQEKAGAPKEALQTYEQYLRESPDASDRAEIEGRVRRLAPNGAARRPIDVEAPGELQSGGGTAPGTARDAAPAAPDAVTGAAAAGSPPSEPPAARPQAGDTNEDLKPIIEDDQSARSALNVTAWVGTGVTAGLFGVAAFFAASASERAGDANRLLLYFDKDSGVPQEYAMHAEQFENDVRLGERDDRLAKAFAIAAGATAIASAVLFILDARAEKPATRLTTAPTGRRPGRDAGSGIRFGVGPTTLVWSF